MPLPYDDGTHIKERAADERDIKEAHARFLIGRQKAAKVREQTTVFAVCDPYLADA